ncbi:MAG: PilZ domain-containing protein [Candidatus Omnitrophica bacterium]|nr:PilZ domain-containing protein [Candidatus Omnitrophota bacterium]
MEADKRIVPRILFNLPVRYRQKGTAGYSDTVGKDISNSGIGFISNEFIPKNSHLVFELHSPWQIEPIQALAEVVWVSNQPCSERFEVGAKFLGSPMQV